MCLPPFSAPVSSVALPLLMVTSIVMHFCPVCKAQLFAIPKGLNEMCSLKFLVLFHLLNGTDIKCQ